MIKKRVVSGMRPTGPLHLGNLHGTLLNWVSLQNDHECFFFIADWHALTTSYSKTDSIIDNVEDILLDWFSAGLNPEKSTMFIQSLVPEHAELYLYLSMITPLPWLKRNPTYKDQIGHNTNKDLSTYGFLGYPVIQAADILIYKTDLVPIGIDQVPHIEITREIARKFNQTYGSVLKEPKEILTSSSKILGIDRKKMSKSYNNAIYLSDSSADIFSKVSMMITDPNRKKKSDPGTPSICNVFEFHKLYSTTSLCDSISIQCKNARIGCVHCKEKMSRNLIKYIEPVQEKRNALKQNRKQLSEIIQHNSIKVRNIAKRTIEEVREVLKLRPHKQKKQPKNTIA